ncbi:MAG TPA: hypothetical protein VFA33_24440 [Bryobacteraceae bacterium]|nr:hypothetical protein [Bryobacteraceae bacterium]
MKSALVARLMVELQQLIGTEGQGRIGSPFVIAEFDFVNSGCDAFDDGADLAPPERATREVFK